jgi:hypothetical protein
MADVRINDLPDSSTYGDLAPGDYILGYMASVDKTVKIPLSALSDVVGGGSSTQLASPALSLSVVGDDEIDASWPAVTSATGYKLYRSETSLFSDAELIYTGSALLFNDAGLSAGTLYYYWLQATASGFLDSGYSQASDTTTAAGVDTTPPVLSSAVVNSANPAQIILTYNEALQTNSSATTTQWSMVGRTITHSAISGTTVTLTLDSGVTAGQVLLLNYTGSQVKDIAGNLAATFSNQAVINGVVASASQLIYPNLTASPISDTEINLTWVNVPNESSYSLEMSTDSGSTWSVIATPAANTVNYVKDSLTAATVYWFRIKAVGDGVNFTDSIYSTASAKTNPTTGATFDTILTFTSSPNDSDAGVNGAAGTTNANKQFQFNAIAIRSGTPMTMVIKVTVFGFTSTGVVVDFPDDYFGEPFRYIHSNGAVYNGFFTNSTVNF